MSTRHEQETGAILSSSTLDSVGALMTFFSVVGFRGYEMRRVCLLLMNSFRIAGLLCDKFECPSYF